jgi:hypothetical protein
VDRMWKTRDAHKHFGKRPLGRPRSGRDDTIKIGLRQVGCEDGKWMELAQNRVQLLGLALPLLNIRNVLAIDRDTHYYTGYISAVCDPSTLTGMKR